MKNLDEIMTVI